MDFEEFKRRVVSVFRKKEEIPFSFSDEVMELFKKSGYRVDSLQVFDSDSFKAKVSKVDWVSSSSEKLPRVRRDIVGKRMGGELVLFVDESMGSNRYSYFEIYNSKFDVVNTLWLGDFLTDLDNRYYRNILRTFEDDLPDSFIWKINEEAEGKKMQLLRHKSVDTQG